MPIQTLYKLTTQSNKTRPESYNECTWGHGVSHSGTGRGNLCGPGWIHAYLHPFLAVTMNASHVNFSNPKLWEAKGHVVKKDCGLKVGCRKLTTVREITLPKVTQGQKEDFLKLYIKKLYPRHKLIKEWLAGRKKNRELMEELGYELFEVRKVLEFFMGDRFFHHTLPYVATNKIGIFPICQKVLKV